SPVAVTPVTMRFVDPLLVSVMVFPALGVPTSWLLKVKLAGEKLTGLVTVPVPVPDRFTISGLSVALSVTVRAPDIVPFTVGVNVTLIVQVPLAAIEPEQVVFEIP